METCDLPPFTSQVTPQEPPTGHAQELLRDEVERYLRLLKDAICADLTALQAQIDACCGGTA